MTKALINFNLHAKQGIAFNSMATEILFGGAAGGGKSLLMRAAAISWCGMIPGLQVYLFRRLRDDLIKNHVEGPQGLRALLAPWVQAGFANIVEDEIRFWNGSKIYLCHCKDEKDRFKYLGAEIHVLLIDELTTFTEIIYRFLRSRVRMVGVKLPRELEGRFPRILCSSNPGNLGHHWVKSAFIDPRAPLEIVRMPGSEGGMLRQFIPARLDDNPSMAQDDPFYGAKLEGLGNPALVRAMREGDWNVVAGAFFPEFEVARHVVAPISLPMYWHRFRSFDWGSARPFSVDWWAVSDGELPEFPRGALICYRQWYGARRDASGATVPNEGLRMTAEEVADGIKTREEGDVRGGKTMSGVADPAIFAQDGGPSLANRMAARGVFFRAADNRRVPQHGAMGGWDQLRARLKGDGETPAIFWFDTCLDTIRTLPALQADPDRPEDADSDGEDHAVDSCFIGSTLILTDKGEKPISSIMVGDRVATSTGFHAVTAIFSNGVQEVFSVPLSNGRVLIGTKNHPVWVEEFGFVPLISLRYGCMLRPCASSLSAQISKNSTVKNIIGAVPTFRVMAPVFIEWFGNIFMDLSQKVRTFTIAMAIRKTISQKICFAFPLNSTCPTMGNFAPTIPELFWKNTQGQKRPNGILPSRGANGMSCITKNIVKTYCIGALRRSVFVAAWNIWRKKEEENFAQIRVNQNGEGKKNSTALWQSARNAERNFPLTNSDLRGFVQSNAHLPEHTSGLKQFINAIIAVIRLQQKTNAQFGVLTVVGEPTIEKKQKVYNLSVEEAEEYFAEGILVHNCRYAVMSRPYTAPLPADMEPERDRYARGWRRSRTRGSGWAA